MASDAFEWQSPDRKFQTFQVPCSTFYHSGTSSEFSAFTTCSPSLKWRCRTPGVSKRRPLRCDSQILKPRACHRPFPRQLIGDRNESHESHNLAWDWDGRRFEDVLIKFDPSFTGVLTSVCQPPHGSACIILGITDDARLRTCRTVTSRTPKSVLDRTKTSETQPTNGFTSLLPTCSGWTKLSRGDL